MSHYIFDNAGQQAKQRFDSLETNYDPWTIRHLKATGIGPGWQCWEVGGGGGSIASWLAEQSGPLGHVLVTDLDPRFLVENAALAHPHIEIQRHDIGADPPPAQQFDLVHARLVLIHVPARELALQQMVVALRPGGWLVVDDFDTTLVKVGYPTAEASAGALLEKVYAAQNQLMAARSGVESLTWGRSLYQRLRAQGLVDVGMEGALFLREGGSPGARGFVANFEQIRQEAISRDLVTAEEMDQALTLLEDPQVVVGAPVMFTAWGRRP
jgi:ubiquinone/menaquinone biosynthesis C-methylase UbiE